MNIQLQEQKKDEQPEEEKQAETTPEEIPKSPYEIALERLKEIKKKYSIPPTGEPPSSTGDHTTKTSKS